ncbi:gamma-adducin-like [Sinocyclocheilus grahami]|uniref:gamma-adducin-like n=1 Tax=Sinocyclocheilus grahami TaxID=75366 RepID=UPI0007AC68FD|nr:PREDICTED: gamma-adducin-like [Sinocyclocheilus grahami]
MVVLPTSPEAVEPPATLEPETPNPFNELTDQALDEYRKEVQRKQHGQQDDGKITDAVQNDKGDEKKQQEELEKQMKALSTTDTSETTPSAPPNKPAGNTPEGSPSKSPLKKKKKFKAPCFLKKSKKQKEKAES